MTNASDLYKQWKATLPPDIKAKTPCYSKAAVKVRIEWTKKAWVIDNQAWQHEYYHKKYFKPMDLKAARILNKTPQEPRKT